MIEFEDVEYDVILLIVSALNFFHSFFDLIVYKAHVVLKVFHSHISQVDFYVADYGAGHGIFNGQDVVD